MQAKGLATCLFSVLLIAAITAPAAFSQVELEMTINTDKQRYHYRQLVTIYGNVTLNDQLVDEGLVAIQFQDPLDRIRALRTVPANATPQNSVVEITSFQSTDDQGNPKTSFKKGSTIWFNISVFNSDPFQDKPILLTITLCDYDSTPFKYHYLNTSLTHGTGIQEMVRMDLNPYDGDDWVSTGTATAYANVYADWPANEGLPYCPEKTAVFTITSSTTLTTSAESTTPTQTNTNPQTLASNYNSYQVSIRLPPNVPLGTYTITTTAASKGYDTHISTIFYREYELRGDIVFDRKIDIFDVVAVATSYGTQGGEPKWNPEADLDPNGKVEIFDVVTVASIYNTKY